MARSRHYQYEKNGYWQYDGTSDFGRIQRQNAFLKALINQAETKYNPLTLNAFIGSVVQGVTIDSTFTVSDLISLARQFHTFASQSLATATLPTYSPYSLGVRLPGDVLYVQQPQAAAGDQPVPRRGAGRRVTPPPGPYGAVSTTTTTTVPPPPSRRSRPRRRRHRPARPPPSRPTSTPPPAERPPGCAGPAGRRRGQADGLALVEALGQGVPGQGGALDADRELDHALEGGELAEGLDVEGLGLGGLDVGAVRRRPSARRRGVARGSTSSP